MIQKMPSKPEVGAAASESGTSQSAGRSAEDWRSGLPVLSNDRIILRELKRSDALPLFTMLSSQEVHRYMSAPPPDVAGFERFIEWTHAERASGRLVCFAVVPTGCDAAVGIMQVKQVDAAFTIGEWGAVLGSSYWGTGVYEAAVDLLFGFLFDRFGLRRLELRAAVQNGRANGAARKVGGVPEGVARRALFCQGEYHDQLMWSVLADDWRQSRIETKPTVH